MNAGEQTAAADEDSQGDEGEYTSPAPRSRYVVGIDLGTTNCAVAYVDTGEQREGDGAAVTSLETARVETFSIPQTIAAGEVETRDGLPSFHYEPAEGEFPEGSFRLPWTDDEEEAFSVGAFARDQGLVVPGRQVSSAKSWLCHAGVDRTASLLPWHAAADVTKISPVEASARYLAHMRAAWDAAHPREPLAEQQVVITLPASFDEVARELTVKAAQLAGLPRVTLIEEPQAAFYAWLSEHRENWEEQVAEGQLILICDIGGGTTDFSLIQVRPAGDGRLQFQRIAVGEHLILGGDNLDLALARMIEEKLTGGGQQLTPAQWSTLTRVCRQVKETLLGENPPDHWQVNLPGSGSRLIGGGLQVDVTREEVEQLLVEGFLPLVPREARPEAATSGFREFGLPFAPDAAMSRYLAAFLADHEQDARWKGAVQPTAGDAETAAVARPDRILFNGGLFASPVLRKRMLEVIENWFAGDDPEWSLDVLRNERLDLAVAQGAAWFGMVQRGAGVRIAAGLARTWYAGVETGESGEGQQAVCLVPAGAEPGQQFDLAGTGLSLLTSVPVEFPLYVSSTRLTDRPGDVVTVDLERMKPLPPIRTTLKTRQKGRGDRVRVDLHAKLSEIGTLELWCSEQDGGRSWKLQFDVRSAVRTDLAAHTGQAEAEGHLEEAAWNDCAEEMRRTFDRGGPDPDGLMKRLEGLLGLSRREWPTSLLRRMWEELVVVERGRKLSAAHEARWLNLLGYSLRPGFGLAVDDWRVARTRKLLGGRLLHDAAMCRAEWWIVWRRICGGMTGGQQQALASSLLARVRQTHRRKAGGRRRSGSLTSSPHETAEVWRLLASLELLDLKTKVSLGDLAVDLLRRQRMQQLRPALIWCAGRLGARQPFHAPLNAVVPSEQAAEWLRALLPELTSQDNAGPLTVMQLARRTGDRYRDLAADDRQQAVEWLQDHGAAENLVQLVSEGGELDTLGQSQVFGESLPGGLQLT